MTDRAKTGELEAVIDGDRTQPLAADTRMMLVGLEHRTPPDPAFVAKLRMDLLRMHRTPLPRRRQPRLLAAGWPAAILWIILLCAGGVGAAQELRPLLHRGAVSVGRTPSVLPTGRQGLPSGSPGMAAAWSMAGHDSRRTSQGGAVGPQRATAPRLVSTGLSGDPPLVGADGTLYGMRYADLPRADGQVVAVSPDGRVRWSVWANRPGWRAGDTGPVLAPDGQVSFGGGACRPSAAASAESMGTAGCLTTVGPDGRVRWQTVIQGFQKNLPQPLVRPDGVLVRATVGPQGFPIMMYSSTGVGHPLGSACSWAATALGSANRLYAITYDQGVNGVGAAVCPAYSAYPTGNGSSVVAFNGNGTRAWLTPLPLNCAASAITVDTTRARIYVAALCGKHGTRGQNSVYALNLRGRLLWTAHGPGSTPYPTLALDRASGDLWLADTSGVQRLAPSGIVRWRHTWRPTPWITVTLVLDARGTAYVFGGDGSLRALSPAGAILWQYQFPAVRNGLASLPSAALGPDGTLYVSSEGEPGIVAFGP